MRARGRGAEREREHVRAWVRDFLLLRAYFCCVIGGGAVDRDGGGWVEGGAGATHATTLHLPRGSAPCRGQTTRRHGQSLYRA